MADAVQRTYSRILFVVFTLGVLSVSAVEVASEFAEGQALGEMLDDLALLGLSVLITVLLIREFTQQQVALGELRKQLSDARGRLEQIDNRSSSLGRQYRDVMQKQFDAWALTASEQDIVIALLKGLSFREVAALRDTREKTVRQQAASVYRKSGLSGRHELAGWFLEDMLEPRQPDDTFTDEAQQQRNRST